MNQNGQILLKTLDDMEEPATIAKIIKYVAKTVNVRPVDVKKTVETTLKAGVRHGYIQCDNNKFFTKPPIIDDDALSCTDTTAGDCTQCRKLGGKKRRSSRSRSHSGTRRRRRSRSGTHGRRRSRSRGNSRRRPQH